jgi:uncharacterized protein
MSEKQSRRDFLVKPVQWVAAAGLLGGAGPSLLALARAPQGGVTILTRTLGRTGLSLPVVSLGFMNADVPGLIRRAYDLGMRHIDTAAFYQAGRNEEMVGAMIKEMGVRDRTVIATKVYLRGRGVSAQSPQARSVFREIFEGSLERLQTDHVDILYYHSVDSAEDLRADGPLQALTELKKEGKARFIGVSTHQGAAVLPEAVRLGVFDVGLVPFNWTMASNKALLDAIDQAAKSGMGLVAMKTQAGGLSRPDRTLPKALPPHSQTALLKWALHNQAFATAIPGVTAYDQLEQNMTVASSLEYSAAEQAFLADPALAAQAQFCQQCGECRGDCPRGVDIPALMRSHMYAVQYSNSDLARTTLASVDTGRGLAACGSCGACEATCRNHVNIGAKIEQLKAARAYLTV